MFGGQFILKSNGLKPMSKVCPRDGNTSRQLYWFG